MKQMKIGILGTSTIAARMAQAIQAHPHILPAAVAGRNQKKSAVLPVSFIFRLITISWKTC